MATLPALMDDMDEVADEGMDDTELVSLLQQHETRSIGHFDNEIAGEQALAINYYYGKMDDLPAQEGGSSVVDNTVAVMVDNGLAAVLKPFVSADEVVSFAPRGPEDEKQAEQATEYVNYVIQCDNPGFQIFHDWFKDALLTKLGIVKVWWQDEPRQQPMDAMELLQARMRPDYLGEQEQDGGYTAMLDDGRIKVMNVPPEEFLITPYARDLDDAPYVAHKPNNVTRSDLLQMGFDAEIVENLPAYSDVDTEEQRRQARYRDEDFGNPQRDGGTGDTSQDIIGFIEEYVRVDYDGDGVAELRCVCRVHDQILYNEEVEDVPFATICPVPMPHKVYGIATADQAIQEQKVATAIKRQTLENLYKSNNPRPIVGDQSLNEMTWDDIGETAPGAAIRVRGTAQGAIDWLVVPFSAQYSMPMLEMTARNAEERTGFQRKGNGFNAEALKKNSPDTATQASIDENSRNERAEMIARIFAETGVKRLFKMILKLLVENQPRQRVIRLRNEWVEIDPRGWSPDMDLTISVGLGIGNKAERLAEADSVLQTLGQLADPNSPFKDMVKPENIYNAVKNKLVAVGIKNVEDYLTDPRRMGPQQPKPDPEMAKVQSEAQRKMQQQQFDQHVRMQDEQHRQQIEAFKVQTNAQLQQQRAAFEAKLAQAKAAFEARLAQFKTRFEMTMEAEHAQHEREDVNLPDNRAGGDLDK